MTITEHLRCPFAILAGAGISYPPPSSLPRAVDIAIAIIEALPIDRETKDDLKAALSWSWKDGIGYYHFLRFEQIVEALELTVDPGLMSIRRLLGPAEPNLYHYTLARLLSQGFPIITTNFDGLIEDACRRCGFEATALVSEKEYKAYETDPRQFKKPLFKIHGSLAEELQSDESDIVATMTDATHPLTSPSKWGVVKDLLGSYDLLVIGYSGSDDFDVMPNVMYAPNSRRVCWVCHSTDATTRVYKGLDGPNSLLRLQDRKLSWFFNRMFLSFDAQFGKISRRTEGAQVVEGNTATLLGELGLTFDGQAPLNTAMPPRGGLNPGDVIQTTITPSDPKALLLGGRLLQEIGRYEKASYLLHSFLGERNSALDSWARGRAHLWLGQMAHERSRLASAESHTKHAYRHFHESRGVFHWTDVAAIETLIPYLPASARALLHAVVPFRWPRGLVFDQSFRGQVFEGWRLGRKHIASLISHLVRGDVVRAKELPKFHVDFTHYNS